MLTAGSVVAGYRIERVLGSGGMGEVYLATHPSLPRNDALKVLSAELSGDPDFRARFIREADVAARLDHPNIVSIYNRGQTDEGQLWIAMQFVDGTDADKALRAGTMTPARAVYIVGEVAKALDYAGQRGVVHRDVKPANFLLSGPVGPDERVLLGDFGIARALGDVGLTVTGSVMATLSFAAPEVLSGLPFDGRADLYSLGCTLFRMLTGKAPFTGAEGMAAVVAAHLQAPPPRVSEWAPGLSPRMDAVIATAMAKNPAHRFSSGRELAAAAAEALGDSAGSTTAPWQPISTAEVSSYPRPTDPNQPQWWQPVEARTMMAPPALPPYTLQAPPAGVLPPRPPSRRRRQRRIAAVAAAIVAVAVAAATVATLSLRSHPQHGASPPPSSTPASSRPPSSPATTTTATGPVAPVPSSALSGFLLPAEQIKTIIGAPTMQVTESNADSFANSASYISDKDCTGPYQPADLASYTNTGSTGSQLQFLQNPAGADAVQQAVIAFPTADAAQKVFADRRQTWAACAGRTFTLTLPNETPHRWNFSPLTTPDGNLVMTASQEGRNYMGCQRALTARNNVIVDVGSCSFSTDKKGVDILNAIAAKIPH
ncbi:MAG: serine/threonine-protein kinase PknH/PknJ [Mycobacterium sp.]